MKPLLSVVIPTYNRVGVLLTVLKEYSLQSLKHEHWEVVVSDDGSTDNTVEIIKTIYLLRQQHKGPGEARNLGAKQAKGEILVFVDADMTFDKDFIKKLVKPITDGKAIGTFSKE